MSDLRHDPINDQWVSIARNRCDRPMEFVPMEQARQQFICPFCKGNEEETPTALAAYRSDGSQLAANDDPASWMVRVVPNLYPSFSEHRPANSLLPPNPDVRAELDPESPFRSNHSPGIQELIIPSSRHVTSLSELNENELTVSFKAYQDRMRCAQSVECVKHTMLFMNCRPAAGASLGHVHSQLIGSPVVSDHLRSRVRRNDCHLEKHGQSLIESVIDWEVKQETRVVESTENFCIICPYASRFAFQVWIVPRSVEFDFLTCSQKVRDELAIHCRRIVSRFETLHDNPGYNILFHKPPVDDARRKRDNAASRGNAYVELFPRLTRAAGFEWGTDIWVNPVAPESAARQLRVGG